MDTKLTPMLRQYLDIKKRYPQEILFFRMGDFYEMFFEDAHTASSILSIALTKRQNDVPMCGVPFHAAESYISRLIKAGHRVAICEQMETVPSEGNKIVKRDVVRIMTPGTLIESHLLTSDENNFLAAIVFLDENIGLSFVDVSTGDFFHTEISRSFDMFKGLIARFMPREIIMKSFENHDDSRYTDYIELLGVSMNRINEWLYDTVYLEKTIKEIFEVTSLSGLSLESDLSILTAGSILEYIRITHKRSIGHLKIPRIINSSTHMMLDDATINNLELITNAYDRTRSKTLFSVLNHSKSPMGKRLLERTILQPLTDKKEIEQRLDKVQYFYEYQEFSDSVSKLLTGINDIERLLSRFSIGRVTPKDFQTLQKTIENCAAIKELFKKHGESPLHSLAEQIETIDPLSEHIKRAFLEEPALSPEQGRVIAEGYNEELDSLHSINKDSRSWILEYQEKQKKELGINTLKIKYNRVHGYYIEVSKNSSDKIPDSYLRKQTLVNAERYTTEILQELETKILTASERIVEIENGIIKNLHSEVQNNRSAIQKNAGAIAKIDLYLTFATAARQERLVRPEFEEGRRTEIVNGRHPVVEKYYTNEVFIPNDVLFDGLENSLKIITGPNMSGKSTYMRMCALIQLMAQVGSFIPADSARLSIVDRIFTRIGASDNISRGESTFLVEMNETATILNNATDKSLIIMDEVGRGTSTYDGLSLAYAIVEYIANYIKARTLFATHYHELTELEKLKGVVNYNVMVQESAHSVDFLHKVVKGAADKSYGIHVAKLAGIPKEIISKASQILKRLETKRQSSEKIKMSEKKAETDQVDLFNAANHIIIKTLEAIDTDSITPFEALTELNRLKSLIDK
ncbi:MAG: DNA mismatch repair protein MutS [Spirochaetes bacterium]|jgi:DNA mismatch repair protein MutS|nr:DNA mismatch repair protein MutS [Spirochaetota bacterium]